VSALPIVVIGGGQAGFTLVDTLRTRGYDGPIMLVEATSELPYQRPPLSKAYLAGTAGDEDLPFRPASYYAQHDIDLRLGQRLIGIDERRGVAELSTGETVAYRDLVLATGSAPRLWPGSGAPLVLQRREHAVTLRESLADADSVLIIGAGFIGLEVASYTAGRGMPTTVLEAADRVLPRSASATVSAWLTATHRQRGVDLRCGVTVSELIVDGGRTRGARLDSGEEIRADVVLLAIGSMPAPGPYSASGVAVDEYLRARSPRVYAVGDVAVFPRGGERIRLESVQNATDQARCVASTLMGTPEKYTAVPWFWTEQVGTRLRIAGLIAGADQEVVRGDIDSGRFSVFSFRNGRLLGAESVNAAADHMAVRSLLACGGELTADEAADASFDLKARAASARASARASDQTNMQRARSVG